MSIYFFETSALAKRYSLEIGTGWVQQVVQPSAGLRILVAALTPIEIVSSLANKPCGGNC